MMELRLVLAILAVSVVVAIAPEKDRDIYCAACNVIIEEVEYAVSIVDPKKTIQIEGFRVDPNGNQKTKTIPFARSETHLTEVVENLCSGMNKFAQSKDNETGKIKFIRTESRNGESVTLENVSLSGDISQKLRYVCDNIIEEYEENLINYFKQNSASSARKFCREMTGLCSENDLSKTEL